MANVTIAGVTYNAVPRIDVPKAAGGGNAPFYDTSGDTATAADVLSGKTFHGASGQETGTAQIVDTFSDYTTRSIVDVITITKIGSSYTFLGMGGLKNVVFGDGITRISADAFYNCTNLNTISGQDITDIGANAFYSCSWLTDADFPKLDWVQGFRGCSRLTELEFPVARRFQSEAFYGCTALTSAIAPNITYINTSALRNCTSLNVANYPMADIIGQSAFYGCTILPSATIRANTQIAAQAFYNCYILHDLYITGTTLPSLANVNAFQNTPIEMSGTYADATARIHVRPEMVEAYASATNWSTFASKIVGDYSD